MDFNCNESTNGRTDANPSIKEITESLAEITDSLKEQFCEFELRFDRLETKTNMNNSVFSRLSEEMSILKNVVGENVRKNENLQHMFMKTLPMKDLYTTKLASISLPHARFIAGKIEYKLHKLLWIFIHIVVFLISATYIQDAYDSWQNSLVVQSTTVTQVKEIPFPAVTICEPILLKEEYNQFEELKRCLSFENKTSWICSEEELNMLLISMDISPLAMRFENSDQLIYSKLYSKLLSENLNRSYGGMEYLKYIDKLGKECSSRLKIYSHGSTDIHYRSLCDSSKSQSILVVPLPTDDDGVWKCQTVNGLSHGIQDITNKNTNKKVPSYGFRKSSICSDENKEDRFCIENMFLSGELVEIEVEDTNGTNLKEGAREYPEGYLYFIHNPYDRLSRSNSEYHFSNKHTHTFIILSPNIVNASKDLTFVDVSKRGCEFSFEKKLSFFEFYTYQNCILECQINCSLSICGCVPLRIAILNSSIKVCSKKNSKVCTSTSKIVVKRGGYEDDRCSCDCLPDCVSISYEVTNLRFIDKSNRTQFWLGYKEHEFPSTYRHSLTSPAEFVAYSLGILGTFNGFSVMMVWKILYWLTLRLWFTVKRTLH